MTLCIFYFTGVALAAWMLKRSSDRYDAEHPEGSNEKQYGFFVVGAILSWATVAAMFFGSLTSFNQLEWDDESFGEDIAQAIDEMNGDRPNTAEDAADPEILRQRRIEEMRERELKAAQDDALRHKRDF